MIFESMSYDSIGDDIASGHASLQSGWIDVKINCHYLPFTFIYGKRKNGYQNLEWWCDNLAYEWLCDKKKRV